MENGNIVRKKVVKQREIKSRQLEDAETVEAIIDVALKVPKEDYYCSERDWYKILYRFLQARAPQNYGRYRRVLERLLGIVSVDLANNMSRLSVGTQ